MKKFKMIIGLMVLIFAVGVLSACEEEEFVPREGASVVIIAGRHANANWLSEKDLERELSKILKDSVAFYMDGEEYVVESDITVIISDGNPTKMQPLVYGDREVTQYRVETYSEDAVGWDNDIDLSVRELLMHEDIKANDKEVDLHAAISEAAHVFGRSTRKEKHLIILDTGVVTTGTMDMNVISFQNGTIDEVIASYGTLPDLNGVKLTFLGLGNVAGDQTDLRSDRDFTERFVELWKAYFEKCGVDEVYLEQIRFYDKSGTPMSEGYPEVTPVAFRASERPTQIITEPESSTVLTETPGGEIKGPLVFNNLSELAFEQYDPKYKEYANPDTPLKDEAAAIRKLKEYEDYFYFLRDSGTKIYVVGSVAKSHPELDSDHDKVSEYRAKRIIALLEQEFQFPADQLKWVDAGTTEFSWRNADEFPTDSESEPDFEAMEKNRVVCLIPDIPNAKPYIDELLNAGYKLD